MGFNLGWKEKRWGHERAASHWNGWRGAFGGLFADDAAMAYSLRRVVDGADKSIRVRRSLDNTEQDIGFDDNGDLDTTALKNFTLPSLLPDSNDAAMIYSLRKVNSEYTGSAVRVRRSSDNVEQDIGFDDSGSLDSAELVVFVGANEDGFVTRWYDQSGNGRDVLQSNAPDQPKIVNNNSVITVNGKPAIDFTSSYLKSAVSLATSVTDIFVFGVWRNDVLVHNGMSFNLSPTRTGVFAPFHGYIYWEVGNASSGRLRTSTGVYDDTDQHQYTFAKQPGTNHQIIKRDGVLLAERTQGLVNTPVADIFIGAYSAAVLSADVSYQELIFYFSDKWSDIGTIENNQKAYWVD